MEPSNYSVRAAERVADILDALRDRAGSVSLAELAEITGMPKSSVFRYLSTLEARGYVEKDPDNGTYSLGIALPTYTQYLDVLAARIHPDLELLRDRFGETVNFGVLDGTRVLYVAIVESHRTMRLAAKPGDRDYLHSTALGKAILATIGESEARRLLRAAGMPRLTSHTITRPDALMSALEEVSRRGYAIDDEENEEGARCVAVPISGARVAAGISISAPEARLRGDQPARVASVLLEEAPRLSRRVTGGFAGNSDPAA
jgi:DNA-binding IclR family transcriptional regulator